MASKSAIGFAISKGLERYKVILHFLRRCAAAGGSRNQSSVFGRQSSVARRPLWFMARSLKSSAASPFIFPEIS
jgi:hypothetical protein